MCETYKTLLDRAIEAIESAIADTYSGNDADLRETLDFIIEERENLEALETMDDIVPGLPD